MPTILIVDDEPSIIDALRYNLEKLHYHVLISMDGEDALTTARNKNPDLIVLDLMLPGVDGIEVCRELRTESAVPIIMLTARDEEIDRVVGLELGADDYVVKPFSMRELMARIKSVLRRSSSQMSSTDHRLQNSELQISVDRHEAFWAETRLDLSKLEFDLLTFFMRHPGQALSREQLLEHVWGYDFHGDTRVVDTAVKRLRKKLDAAATEAADMIITVRALGYKLDDRTGEI
ncbi:MAG: response regulator [Anaerolineales bacterium]|jgi:two-component system alkaline phosphatase synthesis response regulator PhoP